MWAGSVLYLQACRCRVCCFLSFSFIHVYHLYAAHAHVTQVARDIGATLCDDAVILVYTNSISIKLKTCIKMLQHPRLLVPVSLYPQQIESSQ